MARATAVFLILGPVSLAGTLAAAAPAAPAAGAPIASTTGHPARQASPFGTEAQAQSEAMRRREMDDLRRKDAAEALARLGEPVRWQEHSLRELGDWRLRAEEAAALRAELGVTVDWHKLTLERLLDMRLRAAKAAELATGFGVAVDWQRYSWVELEAMRRMLHRIEPAAADRGPQASVGSLLEPTFGKRAERRSGALDPDAVIEPSFIASRGSSRFDDRDPDAVIRPRFGPRAAGRADARDPDAVLRPRFRVPPVHAAGDGPDDLIEPTFTAVRRLAADSLFAPTADDPDDLIYPNGIYPNGR